MDGNGNNPDILPEASLIHGMDGVVQELTSLYGMTDLEACYIALLTNIEGLAESLIDRWKEQGGKEDFNLGVTVITGLAETIEWGRDRAIELIDCSDIM